MHENMEHSEGKMLRPLVEFALNTLKRYDDSHFITDKKYAYNAFAEHFAEVMRNEGLDVDADGLKKMLTEQEEFGSYLADYLK